MRSSTRTRIDLRILILIPILTYVASYLYLAHYHGKALIFNTVVHEGGTYTLLQNMLYASHFLGHIPVHLVLAFLFVGSYLCLSRLSTDASSSKNIKLLFIMLALFLVFSFSLSLALFGSEDTFSYICQQKQGVVRYEEGGSWNLHLPSTLLLFLLVPVYIYVFQKILGTSIVPSLSGLLYLSLGVILFLLFSLLFNKDHLGALFSIWGEPRYLAHSVRELMTFPLTYFPIPLYFLLRGKKGDSFGKGKQHRSLQWFIAGLAIVFMLGLCYQSCVSLSAGIGDLAHKPDFAKGGKLGISYLLASHYFEHFLDAIFFTLLCLLLYGLATRKSVGEIETR